MSVFLRLGGVWFGVENDAVDDVCGVHSVLPYFMWSRYPGLSQCVLRVLVWV